MIYSKKKHLEKNSMLPPHIHDLSDLLTSLVWNEFSYFQFLTVEYSNQFPTSKVIPPKEYMQIEDD